MMSVSTTVRAAAGFAVQRLARLARAAVISGAVLVAAAGVALDARAQGMGAQFDIGTSAVSKRSLEDYAKMLGMDDVQKEAAADLLSGYREQLRAAREARDAKLETLMEDMRDSGDWMGMQKKVTEEGMKFRDEFKKLEEGFTSDVKALLTEKQLDKWPDIERHRRRELHLRFQFYTGGAVDVVSVVNRSGTAVDSPEFRDLLSQYEVAMDNQLKSWEEEGKKIEEEMKGDTANVFAAQQKAMEDMGKVSKQIRDLNREYANRVMSMMNEEQKGKFEAAFNERAYPRVYKKVFVQDQLDAAAKLEDLDTTQKETVSMLRDQWSKESKPLNAAYAQAVVAEEDESGGMFGSMMKRFGGMNGGDDKKGGAVKEARESRKALEDRISKRLAEVLTPQQKEKLPRKKPTDMNPWADMFGTPDGGDEE